MRIAFYNQMFGFNGKNPISNIIAHYLIHFQKKPNKIYQKINLRKTIELVKETNADIVGLAEIIEGSEGILKKLLEELGYKHIYFGNGHKTKFSNLYVKVLIASKINCKQIQIKDFPVSNELGGGGGILHCILDKQKIDIWCIHSANPNKKELYNKQIDYLIKNIKNSKNRVILIGDFNQGFDKIKSFFPDFKLASNRIKTCSTTPIFKIFKFQDLDHILIKGLDMIECKGLKGYSDHNLITADFKI